MKKGMSLLLWTSFVTEEHLPVLDALAEMGYDGVEVPVAGGEDAHYSWLGEQLRSRGLAATAVGMLGVEEDPASPEAAVRGRSVLRMEQLAGRAATLGASLLAGPLQEAYAHFPGPIREEELAWSADSLAQAAERAAAHGVSLMIEPLNRFESRLANTAGQAAALVRRAGQPNLGVTFDTHHAHLEADDLLAELVALGPQLGHVQLSENHRGVPGTGQIDFAAVGQRLRAQNFDGWLVIEAFSRIDPAWGQMLHVWRDLADDWQLVCQKGLEVIDQCW